MKFIVKNCDKNLKFYYSSEKYLNSEERNQKYELEQKLLDLIEIGEFGIRNSLGNQVISIRYEKDDIIIDLNDNIMLGD